MMISKYFQGAGIRLIAFCIYIGLATLAAFVGCVAFFTKKPDSSLGFGPMSCTHEYDPTLKPPYDNDDYGIYQFKMRDKLADSCKWDY